MRALFAPIKVRQTSLRPQATIPMAIANSTEGQMPALFL